MFPPKAFPQRDSSATRTISFECAQLYRSNYLLICYFRFMLDEGEHPLAVAVPNPARNGPDSRTTVRTPSTSCGIVSCVLPRTRYTISAASPGPSPLAEMPTP